jgi:ribose transport system ATP-binding protein
LAKITGMLQVAEITKTFGPVAALKGVSLRFELGEVHGVIGENGAGKSTLMKILSGLEAPSSGTLSVNGDPIVFGGVRDAMNRGIVMIHQELNLVDDLTVAENVFLGREPKSGIGINFSKMEAETVELLRKVNASISPSTLVRGLSIAQKQLVEIAKALSYNAKVIIMDEPTAVLTDPEVASLFALIRDLKANGTGIIYISHLLPEILEICDRVSILRDGECVGELDPKVSTPRILAESMVGRELGDVFPRKAAAPGAEPVLEVKGLRTSPHDTPVSFELRPGEILGMAGLIGAGRTEIGEAIAGFRNSEGEVVLKGKNVSNTSSAARRSAGIAYVSEDRKGRGLHLSLAIAENIALPTLAGFGGLRVDERAVNQVAESWVDRLGIKASGVSAPVKSLSGGNQQKVSVAKWLQGNPKVIILDEPTRGVDVGAKREIYNLIADLAAQGLAVIVISSELPEVIGLCHRVLILRNGHIAGTLSSHEMTEQAIMSFAAGAEERS